MVGGVGGETAGLAISMGAFVLTAGGLFILVTLLGSSVGAARVATFCWILNTNALLQADAVLSESLFTLLGLAVTILLVATVDASARPKEWLWFGAVACAGLSYYVRYAGVFWAATFIVLILLHFLGRLENRPTWKTATASLATLVLLLLPLMVRNVTLVGDWRGGNNTPVHVPLSEVAKSTPALWFHLLLGNGTLVQNRVPLLLIAAGILLSAMWMIGGTWRRRRGLRLAGHEGLGLGIGIVAVSVVVYGGGIFFLALRSVIAYSPRMYVPLLPHVLALVVCGLAYFVAQVPRGRLGNTVRIGIVGFLLAGYTGANATMVFQGEDDTFLKTEALLQELGRGGDSVKKFLLELPPDTVLTATNGQATGYITRKRTLSLVGSPYSKHEWTETTLREVMQEFRSAYLVVFAQPDLDSVIIDSPLLHELSEGNAPAWLESVEQTPRLHVYRLVGP